MKPSRWTSFVLGWCGGIMCGHGHLEAPDPTVLVATAAIGAVVLLAYRVDARRNRSFRDFVARREKRTEASLGAGKTAAPW